jgi:hypothetical protein
MNRKVLGALFGLAAVVVLISLAFVLPAKHSGAHDLPVGIAGPPQASASIQQTLATAAPGDFEFRSYGSAGELRTAIENREIVGAFSTTAEGSTVMVTSAGGAPIAQTLRGIATAMSAQTGTEVSVEDVVPTTAADPQAAGISGLALPLVIGGIIPAVVLARLLPRKPLQQVGAALGFAIITGFALGAVLHFGLGTIDDNIVLVSLGIALGMSAISLTLIGLTGLLGMAGFGVGVLTMMIVGNPLSGIASSAYWLPSGWAELGQLLPPGASGTLLRSLAFFGGHGGGAALIVLICWAAIGVALSFAASRRTPADAAEPSSTVDESVAVS